MVWIYEFTRLAIDRGIKQLAFNLPGGNVEIKPGGRNIVVTRAPDLSQNPLLLEELIPHIEDWFSDQNPTSKYLVEHRSRTKEKISSWLIDITSPNSPSKFFLLWDRKKFIGMLD